MVKFIRTFHEPTSSVMLDVVYSLATPNCHLVNWTPALNPVSVFITSIVEATPPALSKLSTLSRIIERPAPGPVICASVIVFPPTGWVKRKGLKSCKLVMGVNVPALHGTPEPPMLKVEETVLSGLAEERTVSPL